MMASSSRPGSPVKEAFKKLLSPSKQKVAPPPPSPSLSSSEYPKWAYPDSNSSDSSSHYTSSSSSASSNDHEQFQTTGWHIIDRPKTPTTTGPNKENLQMTPEEVVEKVMGSRNNSPSKLSKRNTKSTIVLKGKQTQETDLDSQFEELMVPRFLRLVDLRIHDQYHLNCDASYDM